MKALFVDSSGWLACEDENDPSCACARQARDGWLKEGGKLLTTDYVVAETLTLIRVRLGLHEAEAWWQRIEGTDRLLREWIGIERAEKARDLFFRYDDKDFSFVDCTSFVVMKELKLKDALTTDVHFAQMGFRVVPPLSKAAK
jgi:predicted nucleic acid-binding protein